jgi:hypothetical protein
MTISNTTTVLFSDAAKASANLERGKNSLASAASALIEAGISVADISRDGVYLAEFQRITAEIVLTSKQFATWSDTELAIKVRVDGKQVNTERGKLVDRVNSLIRNVRNAMKRAEEKPSNGAGAKKNTPTGSFLKVVDDYIARFSKDDASNKFNFDPKVARKHLVAMLKDIK